MRKQTFIPKEEFSHKSYFFPGNSFLATHFELGICSADVNIMKGYLPRCTALGSECLT